MFLLFAFSVCFLKIQKNVIIKSYETEILYKCSFVFPGFFALPGVVNVVDGNSSKK